ncbi:type VI secretion system baseplate subunit TssF [Sulfidibacter corallicola]|uniref:Type VI secretion system baseplate subunit TssF n=1 Tax=Sulfidibacter corallicola TaxID=2818388 RepID=A0A8A4TLV9_SULCO|nr:type VI secretion system baseplate subunit TssF [Sulfidibacter corallicola]QTD50969.1 type VI secretion system baseplate subunit TssF [Sulfidibacter corallicola]
MNHSETFSRYLSELTYLRRMGQHFAKRHPKVAARLQLAPNDCADPHVERLLEGFALLSSRLQDRIDSGYTHIAESFLEVLYPQWVVPVPAMSVAKFDFLDPDLVLTSAYHLPRHTPLAAESSRGLRCRFRTAADLDLWPIDVVSATFVAPDHLDLPRVPSGVATVLKLTLEATASTLDEMDVANLRFYVDGDRATVPALLDALFGGVRGLALIPDGDPARARMLGPAHLKPWGLDDAHALLPYPETARPGFRLLQEYFHFPQKFRFFEIDGLSGHGAVGRLDLAILLTEHPNELTIDRHTFRLGAVPIINLFPMASDPIRIDDTQLEYPLLPDACARRTTEIYRIQHVSDAPADPTSGTIPPYYGYRHFSADDDHPCFWKARRRTSFQDDIPGTDMMLSLVDAHGGTTRPNTRLIFAHMLCTNRGLAAELPSGAMLQLECASPLAQAHLLVKPTLPVDPVRHQAALWQLVANLSLDHLALDGPAGLAALQETLFLFAPRDNADAARQIRGLRGLKCRPQFHHLNSQDRRGFCRGLEITLTVDDSSFSGSGFYRLGAVLDRFFATQTTINSFTRLIIQREGRQGVWWHWPPRCGDLALA